MEEAKSRVGSWDLKFVICNFVICKQSPMQDSILGTCQIPWFGTWGLPRWQRVGALRASIFGIWDYDCEKQVKIS